MRGSRLALAALAAALGCHGQPERLCDRVFVAWAFPDHELSSADDVSGEPGLQLDVRLLSQLPAGRPARLFILGPGADEIEHPETAVVGAGGEILFPAVDVPRGSVRFTVRTDDGCRLVESSRTRFVHDEHGPPACQLSFSPEPTSPEALAPLRVYNRDADSDPEPGMEVEVEVFVRRPDIEVTLLVTDVESGETTGSAELSGDDGAVSFAASLEDGEHAVRAMCAGGPSELVQSTATFELLVDTESPDCELIEPTERVTAADDLDGDPDNGVQILLVGQTGSPDSIGAAAAFFADEILDGSAINEAGQSTSVTTFEIVDGELQDFAFTAFDLAGNRCTDGRTF